MIKPWHNRSEALTNRICDTRNIGLDTWVGHGRVESFRPATFQSHKFNPAQLSCANLLTELFAICDLLKVLEANVHVTTFPMLTDYKPLETFTDRTHASQTLCSWQAYLASFDQTLVHTAGKGNFTPDAISRHYIQISTCTEEEYFISESIDNSALHRAPTLPAPPDSITRYHFFIPVLTPDMSEYQSSASDFAHTESECNLGTRYGRAAG